MVVNLDELRDMLLKISEYVHSHASIRGETKDVLDYCSTWFLEESDRIK